MTWKFNADVIFFREREEGTMADSNFLDKGIEIVKSATEADKRKDYEEAFKLYNQALKYFMTALK